MRRTPIPAVGYLRKSTAGMRMDGRERQENSLRAQKQEIIRLARGSGYVIIRWYVDPGVSGWKRGLKRPGFARMLQDARQHRDFQAILCDDVDRFSRADVDEVQADTFALKEAGVKVIVTVAQGVYDLCSHGYDLGQVVRFMGDAYASNQFSRKLSRRIAGARRDRAKEGRRSGGTAPYGLANDDHGGLKIGDRRQAKIVIRVFNEFVEGRSLNGICSRLNMENIPAPLGGKWHVASLKRLLQQRAYRGDFVYNQRKSGQFSICDANFKVVEATAEHRRRAWKATEDGVIIIEGAYKPLIPPALWDQAQQRLASFGLKGSRRPRDNGYPLTGILICDHCGKPMYGCHPKGRRHRLYRCSTPAKQGMGSCGAFQIREDDILPTVMRLLGEELDNLKALFTQTDEASTPLEQQDEEREGLEQERARLSTRIGRAEENLMEVSDARTRKSLDKRISDMRDQLEQLDELLDVEGQPRDGCSPNEKIKIVLQWWQEFKSRAVIVPTAGKFKKELLRLCHESYGKFGFTVSGCKVRPIELLVDPRKVNEALHTLGTEVRLRWRTELLTMPDGRQRRRYVLSRGRLRLAEKTVKVPGGFYNSRSAGRCSGNRGADRCGSRKDRGSVPRSA